MRIHIVRPKETFVTIANKYQVTLDDLRQFNPDFIQPDCLVAGMKVYIPNLKKVTEAFKDSDHDQSPTSSKEIKKEGNEEVNLTSVKHTLSNEPKEHVLTDKSAVASMKEDKKKSVINKQPKAKTTGKEQETKEIKKESPPPHASSMQDQKRKHYEPWPPIKRTAQSCQCYNGYCHYCR